MIFSSHNIFKKQKKKRTKNQQKLKPPDINQGFLQNLKRSIIFLHENPKSYRDLD